MIQLPNTPLPTRAERQLQRWQQGIDALPLYPARVAEAKKQFRPYFDNAPVYGHGPSLEDFTAATPLTVGTPEQVIERTLGFADYAGDYQRQLFLIDHAGLPLKTVLEQMELLGEILPAMRRGFEAMRPSHVPSDPPTHASLKASATATVEPVALAAS